MRGVPFFEHNSSLLVNITPVNNSTMAILQTVQRVGQSRATGMKKKRRVLRPFVPRLSGGCATCAFRPLTPNHTDVGSEGSERRRGSKNHKTLGKENRRKRKENG